MTEPPNIWQKNLRTASFFSVPDIQLVVWAVVSVSLVYLVF